tara:strand:+ start:6836 stop:8038 length:1203 start_codon:yes stop_codon:yes gene_type:complete
MPLQPYWAPTGNLLIPYTSLLQVGDNVSGAGILPGATIVSINVVPGNPLGTPPTVDYLLIEVAAGSIPIPSFSDSYWPAGVTNWGQTTTSQLTGLDLGYESDIVFTRGPSEEEIDEANAFETQTLSFKEDVKGWVSFKSFIPDDGLSMASDYFTIASGQLHIHHDESVNRNQFYGVDFDSTVDVILNDGPGAVKTFHTLGYEGSQSRIDQSLADDDYYNLVAQPGWSVSSIATDIQEGSVNEFIEKEGKWFNYIKGVDSDIDEFSDFGAFDIQGIGMAADVDITTNPQLISFDNNINTSLQVGDTLYSTGNVATSGGFNILFNANNLDEYGDVVDMTDTTISVNLTGVAPIEDDYIMFAKNHAVNTSSLVGYFASIRLENNAKDRVELFSVGSEITESSK